jgi:hypothetical protein
MLVAGLAAAGDKSWIPAGFFILSSLVALPPADKLVQQHFNIRTPGWVKVALVIALIGAAGAFLPSANSSHSNAASSIAQPSFTSDPRGVAVAKLLLIDDFEGYLDGKKTIGDWMSIFPIGVRISAPQLFAAYHANEVAADDKFKDQPLVITGVIESINKDVFGNGYLVLRDANMFEGVQARLSDDSMKYSGQLLRGDDVTLICKGAGMIIGSPVVKNCDAVPVIVAQQRSKIEDMVDAFLAGGASPPDRLRVMIGIGYVLGTELPKGSDCDNVSETSKKKCLDEVHALPRAKMKDDYRELTKHLSLPPIPEHP